MTKPSVADSEGISRELSVYPVHLTSDKEGNLPPSALVPFCSFQMDYNLLGEKIHELNMTICNKFEPVILEGQLCYSLDLAKVRKKSTEAGKPNGLFLLLDPNSIDQMNNKGQLREQGKFKVYIHTLAQYRAYKPGTYAISSLKKMTGTKSFVELPENQKRCRVHNREECQTKDFLDQVWNKCKCVPWTLLDNTGLKQVSNTLEVCYNFSTRYTTPTVAQRRRGVLQTRL